MINVGSYVFLSIFAAFLLELSTLADTLVSAVLV